MRETTVRRVPEPPLSGRDRDIAEIMALTTGPGSQAVLIRGAAGIGKSRMLREAGARLAGEGWTVLDLGADELDRPVPYSGLRYALAAYADPALGCGAAAGALVEMLDGAAPVEAISATARALFGELTEVSPVALAVDDLELLDDDTLVLVAELLRQYATHPMVLLANLRTVELGRRSMLATFLDRLRLGGRLREIELGPLDEAAVRRLVAAMPDVPELAGVVDLVLRQSGGNPLFAVHSVLNLAEAEAPVPSGDRRRAFLDRVLRVGPQARLIGRAVALLGVVGPARMRLVAELTGLSPVEAAGAFDALVARGTLRLGPTGDYRVSHQIVQDTLYQEIGPAQRWHWHRVTVEFLYALPPSPDTDLEIAAHLPEIVEPGDERAITVLSRAAERAGATAPRSAIPLFERAIALTPADPQRRAVLRSRLARALLLAGRPREAAQTGKLALAELPLGEPRVRLVTIVVDALVLAGSMDEAAALVDAEVADGYGSVRLMAKAAHVHIAVDRGAEAQAEAAAVERGLATVPVAEQIVALGHLARMRGLQSRFEELPGLWERLASTAEKAATPSRLAAYTVIGFTQASAGHTVAASSSIGLAQRLLAEVGWTLYREDLAVAQVQNAVHLGDWASALSIISEITDELDGGGSFTHRDTLRALQVEILANQGEWTAARHAADHLLAGNPHGATIQIWAHAGLDLLAGDHLAARTRLTDHLALPTTPRWLRPRLLARLAAAEIEADRPGQAAELLADLSHQRPDTLDQPTYVAVQLAYGHATGDADALSEGLRVADLHQLTLLRGQAHLLLGALNLDPELNLTEAARIFQSLGATPWRRRAVTELRRHGLKIPRDRSRPHLLLTETELQIARLVQYGSRNREIATAVFLSVKTVEHYLTGIYQKTSCTNRLELARALDNGLLDAT